MRLQDAMQELEILVEFSAYTNATHINSSWCAEIELSMDFGTKFESLPGQSSTISRERIERFPVQQVGSSNSSFDACREGEGECVNVCYK